MRIYPQTIFLQNKYTNWYLAIVERAKNRKPVVVGENHHIIPVCLYKNNRSKNKRPGWIDGDPDQTDNIVRLTFKEHFICHWLLTKMMIHSADQHKMEYALSCFSRSIKGEQKLLTSLEHSRLKFARRLVIKTIPSSKGRKKTRGKEYWWNNGVDESVSAISPGDKWVKGRLPSPLKGRPNSYSRGAQWWTDGVSMQVSKTCPGEGWSLGRTQLKSIKKHKKHVCPPHSEETKMKISIANRGRKRSLETRQKMSEDRKGRSTVTKGSKWYNNGQVEIRRREHPGIGWELGKIKAIDKNKKG